MTSERQWRRGAAREQEGERDCDAQKKRRVRE